MGQIVSGLDILLWNIEAGSRYGWLGIGFRLCLWSSFVLKARRMLCFAVLHRRHSRTPAASTSFAAAVAALRDAFVVGDLVGEVNHEIAGHVVSV